ncbi:hypothetical protein FRC15_001353 [Serendipita sp. 397]|nr:hypothetical protein FRC15_001353 [Serendipita sp. 397]
MLATDPGPGQTTSSQATQCGGCKQSVESDSGGIVVSFGQSLWHVDCFKCAKCGNRVNADTNLLLLSDGSPVCGGCSYHCSVCKQPIVDEAIMTGDDSYHALCFTCRQCSRRIEELVFAKTSQGIYCMDCHNERAARSRRHYEKKKRAKAKLEEGQHREQPNQQLLRTAAETSPNGDSTPLRHVPQAGQDANSKKTSSPIDRTLSVTNTRSQTVPVLSADGPVAPPQRSSSMDDTGLDQNIGAGNLSVPMGRGAKRRSINPGLRLADSGAVSADSTVHPHSPTVTDLYSPSFSVESAAPSPGLVTTGSVAAQEASRAIATVPVQDRTGNLHNDVDREPTFDIESNPPQYGYPEPPSAGLKERSRSNTPVPSNVDANGRASDESETEAITSTTVGAPIRGGHNQPNLPPIELTFHDDPEFSNLLSSFAGDSSLSPLTLRDPAGSRKSMQALANVALMLSEDQIVSGSSLPPPPGSIPTSDSTPPSQHVQEPSSLEQRALPPLPKRSVDGVRTSEDSPTTRSSSDSRRAANLSSSTLVTHSSFGPRKRVDSNNSVVSSNSRSHLAKADSADLVIRRLKEALKDAVDRGSTAVKLDRDFVEAIIHSSNSSQSKIAEMKGRIDGMKRVSQRMFDGLSVAQEEYDQEVASRRNAEAEVTRLRLQLSSQTAQLTALSADQRKRELMEKMSQDMSENLHGLEKHLSQLKAERDLTLAEMEELHSTKQVKEASETTTLSRSLTNRFDNLKVKYRLDLEPLIAEREALQREISELKQAKELWLEETTALTSRNDELMELNMALTRQHEQLQSSSKPRPPERKASKPTTLPTLPASSSQSTPISASSTVYASVASIPSYVEEDRSAKSAKSDSEAGNTLRKFPWFKGKDLNAAARDAAASLAKLQNSMAPIPPEKTKPILRHNFQQQSVLRFARCDYCGDKMWGTQLRCSNCSTACHTRCLALLNTACREATAQEEKEIVDIVPLPPSMFGRDLTEQVQADAKGTDRAVPILVEKCISAVESRGMDYEGIYRKNGGAGQSKAITQAFERGDYDAFNLLDPDEFTDISSVTSVLKNYFRSLPNPLLTFELHDAFVQAASHRDSGAKGMAMTNVLEQMPHEHYETLRLLMLHLNGVMEFSKINLMSARNLGVVFGPTLMRSPDSAKEFADMAGKALCIEWLVENAPTWTKARR